MEGGVPGGMAYEASMARLLARGLALVVALTVFAVLLLLAVRRVEPPERRAVVTSPDLAAPVKPAPATKALRPLRGPATKADPHLAKMLAEEAEANAALFQILKGANQPHDLSPAP